MTISPAGVSPAGFFVPQTYADPTAPPGILADAVDPQTGEYLSISRGMDPIDQQVLIALTVGRGSGVAVQDEGHEFGSVRKTTETARTILDATARRALDRLVRAGDIRIREIVAEADPSGDSGGVTVEYENQRTGLRRARQVGQ